MQYAIIFLLLFSILAAAWFYLQRAKARSVPSAPAQDEPRTES